MAGNPGKVPTDNINEVIIRLLQLKPGTELDYQTYFNIIKKRLASYRMVGKQIAVEEDELLRTELKRISRLKDKGRFKISFKKVKATSQPTNFPSRASDFPSGTKTPKTSKISTKTGAIIKLDSSKILGKKIEPNEKDIGLSIPESAEKVSKKRNPLLSINEKLNSILNTILSLDKENRKENERKRKEAETGRRNKKESDLESGFLDGAKKALSMITKPFQSILDKIFNFIFYTLLGRVIFKLIDWFVDPKNKSKIQSIVRFIKDWWPALLGSYILFGTSFGRLIRGTTGMVGRFIFQIGKVAIPQLLKFIKSPLGTGALLFTAGATIPAMFPGTVNEQERKTTSASGSEEEKIKKLQEQKTNLNLFEKLQGKGSEIDEQISFLQTGKTKTYGFSGGGYANYGNLLGRSGTGAGLGSMFGPMGSLLGAGVGAATGSGMLNGLVSGPKGRDRVPAMLTDGEFVMSVGAVNKYGVETLEEMNAAGGGTNEPKVVGGKTYAFSGGRVGRYSGDMGEKSGEGINESEIIDNIKKFIKYKIGYDLDKPETWGKSFLSAFAKGSPSKSSGAPSSSGQGFDFGSVQNFFANDLTPSVSNLANRGQSLLTKDLTSSVSNLANRGLGLLTNDLPSTSSNLANTGQKFLSENLPTILNKGQEYATNTLRGVRNLPKTVGTKLFDSFKSLSSTEVYKDYSSLVGEKVKDSEISVSDKFIKKIPEGPFRDIMDKGLIPIPTNDATTMRNMTFLKSILGPLGRPFKILSNKEVDDMRQKTIDKTMSKSGLIVDPKTGQVRMNWNQEDINKGAKGGGAFTNDLGSPRGSAFNSILGRFSASTKGNGNILYTDDRYNFNKTVAEYAELAKQGLLKGSMADATYFGASMLGRFAQDIGWLNQRALGSEIEVGKIDKNTLDPKTGRKKSKEQILSDMEKMKKYNDNINKQKNNTKKLESNRPWWDKMGWFGGGSAANTRKLKDKKDFLTKNPGTKLYDKPKPSTPYTPYKSRFSRPSGSSKVAPAKPPSRISSVKPTPQYRGGQRSSGSNPSTTQTAPSPRPTHVRGTGTTQRTLGVKPGRK